MTRNQALGVVAAALVVVLTAIPFLGADPAGLIDAARFDPGPARAVAAAAAIIIAAAGVFVAVSGRGAGIVAVATTCLACLALVCPVTISAVRLRAHNQPWVFVNDASYQVELGADALRAGHDPYGYDYARTPLVRVYQDSPEARVRTPVALHHFAYFPGMLVIATGWRLLPAPLSDLRLLVGLATLALLAVTLMLPGPMPARLVAGLVLAGSPLLVRAAWFGTADALALVPLVAAFALVGKRRFVAAALMLAIAVLIKQFVLIAVVFLALEMLRRGATRRDLVRAGGVLAATILVVCVPFLAWHPGAFIDDTITYGADTYRVVGYGLANALVHAGLVSRYGAYPFGWIALVTWLPATLITLYAQRRIAAAWAPAAGYAVSMLVLVYIARVFQTSYLAYPVCGLVIAVVFAIAAAHQPARPEAVGGAHP